MYKFVIWFKNLKFRNKITLTCLVVSLVPIIMLGSFSYLQIRNLLINREKEVLVESLSQAHNSLEHMTTSYFDVMSYIIWDNNLTIALNSNYNNNFEMYLAYKEVIDPLFSTVRSLHNEIEAITVYSNNNINPHGNILRPLSDIEDSNWFNPILDTTVPHFIVSSDKHQLDIVCQLLNSTRQYTNIIKMNINYPETFAPLSTLFDNSYGIIIIDDDGNPVYEYENFSDKEAVYSMSHYQLLSKLNEGSLDKDYVFEVKYLPTSNWTVYLYRPISTVSAAASQITITIFFIIITCILFLLFASYSLSKVIVRPLEELTDNMEQIESGNLSVTVTQESTDEIGILIQRFGYMVNRIKYMIDEVYKSKILQQKYEMKALQAQISPHFFYNSLSLINSKAILAGHEDISHMAQFLSSFYRTTLNKGKNTTLVKDEFKNVTSYIQIQLMMHSYTFDVSYDIDDDILNYTMLNLLLQPLVENAIVHGIDHKESVGRGLLTIIGKQSNNNLVFTITDNGCGITTHVLESILTTKTKGYGIQNVHHRVQLYYGKEYGLSYESKLEKGTIVCLTIPKNISC
ncbi:sensor histidine kinase [Vallitalea guaymasensis]|uniref:sensor histidine kinase n=1 Tax=Vallitalea guaymasensis TaxID=1185412 RepID=UPI00272B3B88|nr:histidine kinase [Vallitalea guaymasensis]